MKHLSRSGQLVLCSALLLPTNTLNASTPVWTFTPLTLTTIILPPNGTATVQYLVTNQSHKTHTLVMKPITGITQTTTAGNCPSPFVLNYKQSCTLTLQVNENLLRGNVTRGPIVCQQGSALECYQPSLPNSLNISVNTPGITPFAALIAAGYYADPGTINYPLLAQKSGSSWRYVTDGGVGPGSLTPPPGFTSNGTFVSANCDGNICIAAGSYNSMYPLLAQTTNGIEWNYRIDSLTPSLPSDFSSNGAFNGSNCSLNICIAAGSYTSTDNFSYPLIAQSTDTGTTWKYSVSRDAPVLAFPTDFGIFGNFSSAYCNGSICLAGGSYVTNLSVPYPLLAQSTNNGTTWSYSIDSSLTPPPAFYGDNGLFAAVSCNAQLCIAAGSYRNNALPGRTYPLVAQSTNNGATWRYAVDQSTPGGPPFFFDNGVLTSASCNANICIAGGTYSTLADSFPLIVQSTNNGASWTFSVSSSSPPPGAISSGFQSVSCSSTFCVAAGSYLDLSSNIFPLIAQTVDNGATWNYISLPAVPNIDNFATFNSVTCKETTCIAAGTFLALDGKNYPLLAESTDGANTWAYQSAAMPSNFGSDSNLNGTGISTTSFLPNSLKRLYQQK